MGTHSTIEQSFTCGEYFLRLTRKGDEVHYTCYTGVGATSGAIEISDPEMQIAQELFALTGGEVSEDWLREQDHRLSERFIAMLGDEDDVSEEGTA